MKVFIYLLRDPYSLSDVKKGKHTPIRYIGKTNNPDVRWRNHFSGPGTSRMRNWILSLRKEGRYPRLEILEECDESNWHEREEFYINKYLKLGHRLLNVHRGTKVRTDDRVREKIKHQLLEGPYFKLKNEPGKIVVRVAENKYYKVSGNLIKNVFYNSSEIKPGSYYVDLLSQRYIIPSSAIIYSMKFMDLPEINPIPGSISYVFIEQ